MSLLFAKLIVPYPTPESEVRLTQAESVMISPQTEAETLPEPVLSAEESPAVQDPGVAPQTDLGQDDIAGMAPEDDVEGTPESPTLQTDTENIASSENSSRPAGEPEKPKQKQLSLTHRQLRLKDLRAKK